MREPTREEMIEGIAKAVEPSFTVLQFGRIGNLARQLNDSNRSEYEATFAGEQKKID